MHPQHTLKRREPYGRLLKGVVGVFGPNQELALILLMMTKTRVEEPHDFLVQALYFAVRLRMVAGAETYINAQTFAHLVPNT